MIPFAVIVIPDLARVPARSRLGFGPTIGPSSQGLPSQHLRTQPARVDAKSLTDVLEGEHVRSVVAHNPGERLTLQLAGAKLVCLGACVERADAVFENRPHEASFWLDCLRTVVVCADLAVRPAPVCQVLALTFQSASAPPGNRVADLSGKKPQLRRQVCRWAASSNTERHRWRHTVHGPGLGVYADRRERVNHRSRRRERAYGWWWRLAAPGTMPAHGRRFRVAPSPRWYYRPWSVVFLLFFVLGPFGLPLLWKSPGFSQGMKIALTVAVITYSALLIETVLVAVRAAMEQIGLVRAPMTLGISS